MKVQAGVYSTPSNVWKLLDNKFDGDTMSTICVLTDEAKQEIHDKLNSRSFYIAPDGKIAFSTSNDILDLTLRCITGD